MSASSGNQIGLAGNPLKIVILIAKPFINYKHIWLVGGLEHLFFFHVFGIIIPTDFHSFQRGWNHQPDKHCILQQAMFD